MAFAVTTHLEFDIPNKRYRVVCDTDFQTTYGLDPTSTTAMYLLGTTYFNGEIDQQHITTGDPLIDLKAGAVVSAWYDAPLDSGDTIVNGTWTGSFSLSTQMTQLTYSNPDPLPSTEIIVVGNIWIATFLEPGDSVTVSGTNPDQTVVIDSITDATPNVDIITTTSVTAVHTGLDFTVEHTAGTLSHTYAGCVVVTPCVKALYDCDSTEFGTFTGYDDSDYGEQTIVTSTLRIQHPSWTIQPYSTVDSVTTQAGQISKTLTQLYTGPWTIILNTAISFTQDDGLEITYTITQIAVETVTCTGSLCGKQTCINNLRALVASELTQNSGVSQNLVHLTNVLTYQDLATMYKTCGDMDNYRLMLQNIETELNASGCDCGCSDTEYIRIMNVSEDVANAITQLEADLQYRLFDGIPGVNEDSSTGVQVGAIKQNFNTGIEYRCTDNTVGAAVWVEYYSPGATGDKVYIAFLTQTGTSAPVITLVSSNFTGAVSSSYNGVGSYTLTSADSEFATNTIAEIINNRTSEVVSMTINRINTTSIVIAVRDIDGAVINAKLTTTAVRITVKA